MGKNLRYKGKNMEIRTTKMWAHDHCIRITTPSQKLSNRFVALVGVKLIFSVFKLFC